MKDVRKVIEDAIIGIQVQHSYRKVQLKDEIRLTKDLGFSSLDIAQLIALLELELGIDPFSEGVSIAEAGTVGELCRIYQEQVCGKCLK